MNTTEVAKLFTKIAKTPGLVPEQVRMGSPDDRDSYILLVRTKKGEIVQVNDPKDWPPKED